MHINKSLILAHINRGVNNRCCCVQRAVHSQHAAGMGSDDLGALAAAEKVYLAKVKKWSTGVDTLPADDVIRTTLTGLLITDYIDVLLEDYKTAIKDAASLETFEKIQDMITTVNTTALDDAINYIGNIRGETASQSNTDIGAALALVNRGKDNYNADNLAGYVAAIENTSTGPLTSKAEIQDMIKGINAAVTSIENVAGSTVDHANLSAMISAAGVNNYDPANLAGYVDAILTASSSDLNTWAKIQAMVDGVSTT